MILATRWYVTNHIEKQDLLSVWLDGLVLEGSWVLGQFSVSFSFSFLSHFLRRTDRAFTLRTANKGYDSFLLINSYSEMHLNDNGSF